jgi:ribosomal protein L34
MKKHLKTPTNIVGKKRQGFRKKMASKSGRKLLAVDGARAGKSFVFNASQSCSHGNIRLSKIYQAGLAGELPF